APAGLRVDAHAGALRLHARGQRHVLVVGPVGGGAALEELAALHAVFRAFVGIVVVYLVVVPGDEPGRARVRRLQIRIGAIKRMACAIVLEGIGLWRAVRAHVVLAPGRLVDVVAEEDDQVRVVGGDVAVRAVGTLLVLLARGEGEAQPRHGGMRARRGARTSDGALRIAGGEPVPIGTIRLEPARLDVHR